MLSCLLVVMLVGAFLPTVFVAPASADGPYGLQFDGSNDYVTFGAAPGLGTASFTLETWFYWTGGGDTVSTGSGGVTVIPLVTKGRGEGETPANLNCNYVFGITAAGKLAADFEDTVNGGNHPVTGNATVATGVWHHAAATYDVGTHTWSLYLDGVLDQTLTLASSFTPEFTSIQHAGLGTAMTSAGTADGFFQGTMDEARIWNYARSQAEIQATMSLEVTSATGLIGRWGMNEGSGATIADSAVPAEDGTLTNGPLWVSGLDFDDATPPAVPSGLTATGGMGQISLAWTANSEPDLAGYNVYRSETSPVPLGTPLNGILLISPAYVDTAVVPGTPYYYAVTAVDSIRNESGLSAEDDAEASTPDALDLGSGGAYVSFGDPDKLDLGQFTIETWFKRTGTGSTGTTGTGGVTTAIPLVTHGVGEAEDSTRDVNWVLVIDSATGVIGADFEEGATGTNPGLNHPVLGATLIANDVWYHAAATYDGTTWNLYLNGHLEATLAVGEPPCSTSTQRAGLGVFINSTNTASGRFQGVLDEARVWDYARSQAEIKATINSQLTGSESGLVALWSLDDATGTTVTDSAATPANGTIVGSGFAWAEGAPFNLDFVPPAVPAGLIATAGPGQVSLDWNANGESDLAGYNVYRSLSSPVTLGTPLNGTLLSSSDYLDTAVVEATPYFYAVTAVDTSGNESGLSAEDDATPTAPTSFALQFAGTDDYVTFGGSTGLGASSFTLETWFYWGGGGDTVSTGTGGLEGSNVSIPLIAKGRGEGESPRNINMNYFFGITGPASATPGRLAADFEDTTNGGNHPVIGTAPITTGVWHHAAATYDVTTHTWNLYLDGVLDRTLTLASSFTPEFTSIQHAGLGTAMTSAGTADGFFQGTMDEARIWNYARSQAEIQATMNQALASASGLIGRWGLNEGAGTLTGDSTAPAENGTLTNGPLWVSGLHFGDTTAPAAPTGLTATGGMGQISLAWTANSEPDLAGYNVYRSETSPVPLGTPLNGILLISPAYVDTAVVPGTPYYYAVTAVDAEGNESGLSAEDDAEASTPDALDLGSGGAYVSFGDPDKLDLGQFTIETWFMRTGAGVAGSTGTDGLANALPLVTHGSPQGDASNIDANWMLLIDDATDTIAADFEDMTDGGNHPVVGTTPIVNDVWYHAAATYDGTTWRLYLNGHLEVTQVENATPRSDTIQRAGLGACIRSDGGTNFRFDGVLDEVRVWDSALSQAEIKANINSQLTGSEAGLVALWNLDDGSGITVTDSAATPANGTITGTGYTWSGGAPFDADITPPVIAVHGTETAEATGPSGAAVSYTAPTATDEDPPSPDVTCLPASGSVFVLGDTTVNCSATDAHDNVGTSSFTVTVQDTTPPDVASHADVSVPATGPSGAVVNYTLPEAVDLVDGTVTVTCDPVSGSTFPIGDTTVTCSATDSHSNTGQSQFKVTVQDEDDPVVAPHDDVVAEATGPSGAAVFYTPPTATDDNPPNPEVFCDPAPGTIFPLGSTQVDCSATDNSGNTGHSYFQVTVQDTTPPTVGVHADMIADAPGPGGVVVNYTAPTASDLVDGSVPVTCDPLSGSLFPVGETTVTCSATDSHSNTGTSTFKITVYAPELGALDLGSGSAYVTFGDPDKLGLSQFTLETWFKWTGGGATTSTGSGGVTAYPLVTKGRGEQDSPANLNCNWFLGISSAGVLAADFEDTANGANHPVTGNTVVTPNVWHHAAATYDGTTWRLYLDGHLDRTLTVNATPEAASIQHAGLGTALTSTGVAEGHFAGTLDEARVWDYARSQAQIAGSINSELTTGTGLVARWGFSEGSGTVVGDSIATAANGTITNSGYSWVAGAPFDLVVDLEAPAAPTGLDAAGGEGLVTLDWNDNGEADLAGYNVYRSLGSPVVIGTPINAALLPTSAYTDSLVVAGTEYFYAVTAVDDSGNESGLSNEDSATPSEPPPGAYGLQLGTSSAYVTFGDPAKLDLPQFTIETWFMRTGAGTPVSQTGTSGIPNAIPLMTHGSPEADGSNVDANWMLVIADNSDVLGADFEDYATGLNHPITGTTPIVNNQWYHAAATYDGSTWNLYLNGELEASLYVGQPPRYDSIQDSGLGVFLESDGTANGHFTGVLDEARVWNYARSETEIRATINAQLASAQTGLVARWGFAEGSGTLVGDSMATPANGTIINSGYSWVAGAPFDLSWDTTPPAAPTGLDATPGAGLVALDWDDNSESDLAGYNVYRSTVSPVVKGTPLNGSSLVIASNFQDTAVSGGTTYHYAVTAVDASANESGLSAEDDATPTGNAYPDEPILVAPLDGATNVPVPVGLSVVASDDDGGDLDVSFYGRPVGSGTGEPFTLVFLPDTQFYSESYPATFLAQTQWVVNNLATRNIVFMTHVGDIVNTATSTTQWDRADTALSVLDGQVPYGLAPGNHDLTDGGAQFNAYFPVSRYSGNTWYGGHYGSDNLNSWQTFEGSGMQFLILHLANNASNQPTTAVMNWAAGVIDAHPGYRVILTTHDYLNTDGSRDTMGNTIWNGLVNNNCEIFLVLSGHHAGEDDSTAINSCGDTVHQVLLDTQSDPNGGNGWLRLYEFDPSADEINAYTYSPTLGTYDTGTELQFTLSYDMEGEAAFAQIGTTQTVNSGDTAGVSWPGLTGFGYEWYAVVDDGVAQTQGPTWSFSIADTIPPVVADHGDMMVEATSPAGAVVTYTPPTAYDDDPPNPVVTCAPESGSLFAVGDTVVTCTATDNAGNPGSSQFTITVYQPGAYAIDLGSGSGYVSFGDPAKLDLPEFTIETWFKRTGEGTIYSTGSGGITNAIPLVTHGASYEDGSETDVNWVLVIDNTTDVLGADFEDMASGLNHPVLGTTPISSNVWHHAAATYDGTTWHLYLDGTLEATLTVGAAPRSDTVNQAGLGTFLRSTGDPQGHFQGVLDETRVWDYARSQAEIIASINSELTSGTGLVARWGMGEPDGVTVVGDSIAPEADGTVMGSGVSRVAGAPFDIVVNAPPGLPTAPSPADGATDVPVPVTLSVTASDPDGGNLNVNFYGRSASGVGTGEPFTLAVIPDAQNTVDYPATYSAQTQWIVDQRAARNIVFATHLGNLVSDPASQYGIADAAVSLLDGQVPYGLAPGYWDRVGDNATQFDAHFPASRYSGQSWYGGNLESFSADNWNSWQTFEGSGLQFLILHLGHTPYGTELEWAEAVIAAHPGYRVILSTHDYLAADGSRNANGDRIWDNLVRDNCSISLVLSSMRQPSARSTDVNACGDTVQQILQSYRLEPNGGNGYLRYFEFHPEASRVDVYTYSPTLDEYRTTDVDQFSFAYDMGGAWEQVGTTQTVASGGTATVSWPGLTAGEYEWYATVSDAKATTVGPIWSFSVAGEPPVEYGYLRVTTSPAVMSQISVDGIPRDTWGLTWVKLPPGDYEVTFADVPGYTTPAPQTVTVTDGLTTEVTGLFGVRGWLRVMTSPAVPSTISVDGVARNDWGMWTDLPAGEYEVCFGAVEGFATPVCQTATVTAGATTEITGNFVAGVADPLPAYGYLRVTTSPAVMSQISVDGIPRDTWGLTWVKLPPGDYEVSFADVPGYTTPAPQTVTVTEGLTTEVTGLFGVRGWLRVMTSPPVPSSLSVDGVVRNDWGMWTDMPVGGYQVCFGDVPGYSTPACQAATVTAGATTEITGNYSP